MVWVLIITILSSGTSDTYSIPYKTEALCESGRAAYVEQFNRSPVSSHRAVVVCSKVQ
ncbi:hypothetical protein [Aestuariispira ectoiniformans]|uniref:hypothetical protein n=1 Tax=Aestuariispira ectoiniformans TaxID=2775080 RepID=UPI00223B084E|nr:hypothetical protein [Aestuariispira ectoiniformans]